MKQLSDFTQNIKDKIELYKSKCITDLYSGKEYSDFNKQNLKDYVNYIYNLAKQQKPVIIIANNILEYKIYYNLLFNTKKYNKVINTLFNVKNKLLNELGNELSNKLRNELSNKLRNELYNELDNELSNELGNELGNELYNELDNELHNELHNELRNELDNELDNELRNELDNELGNELYNELDNELYNELDNELYNELGNELGNELDNELYNELYNELSIELRNELKPVKSHYIFLLNSYSRVYLMWYKFIKDEFNLPCSKTKELDWLYNNVNLANIARGFFCKKVALVLRMPSKILRNNIGFHSLTNEGAIQYPNQKLHYINGRKIPNWVFDKFNDNTLTFNDFIKETNEDIKAGIITLIKENKGNEVLLNFLNAVLIDECVLKHDNGHIETIKLYKTKESYTFLRDRNGKTNVPYAWTEMVCPSTGQTYLIDTSADFTTALESIKFHRPKFIPKDFSYNWSEFTN